MQMALMVRKMMAANDKKDVRHRIVVAGLVAAVVAVVVIASIEPALACGNGGVR